MFIPPLRLWSPWQLRHQLLSAKVPAHVTPVQVVTTISRGRLVWHHGVLDVTPGTGRYIPMPTHGPLFDGLDKQDAAYLATHFPYGPTSVAREQPGSTSKDEL